MVRIISAFPEQLAVHRERVERGRGNVQKNILAFNNAAKGHPQLIICDLDSAPCASAIISDWFGSVARHPDLILRMAEPEVEAWLLADRIGIANYLGIETRLVPAYPERERDPKATLIDLAKHSPNRETRDAIVPRLGATIGPDYNGVLGRFVAQQWDYEAARGASNSLNKAIARVAELAARPWQE